MMLNVMKNKAVLASEKSLISHIAIRDMRYFAYI